MSKITNQNVTDSSIDLVFNRGTFHHIPEQADYFFNLRKAVTVSVSENADGGWYVQAASIEDVFEFD